MQVVDHVTVQFEDGSKCKVLRATADRLIPLSPASLFPDEDMCPYYPGLAVRAASGAVFRGARWLRGSHWRGRMEGSVALVGLSAWNPAFGHCVCFVAVEHPFSRSHCASETRQAPAFAHSTTQSDH
eukprot:5914753-Pyramimonas_sp.AAC.2